jgi:hypothetical protein
MTLKNQIKKAQLKLDIFNASLELAKSRECDDVSTYKKTLYEFNLKLNVLLGIKNDK